VKISSYNINDVGYHYIGLRVIANLKQASRADQISAISRNIYKYVCDKALRLMLPEPRGSYETIGEKVCQELVHMRFSKAEPSGAYALTDTGTQAVQLLNSREFKSLRRIMVAAQLGTYDNLRGVLQKHIQLGALWRPIIQANTPITDDSLRIVATPVLGDAAWNFANEIIDTLSGLSAKRVEDAILGSFLRFYFGEDSIGIPLFRALCDRLASLRVLNIMRASYDGRDFLKTYSTALASNGDRCWYIQVSTTTRDGDFYSIFMAEPDTKSRPCLSG
jgi:hypothetical protein